MTGGGTGAGRAIAMMFAREGAKVAVAGRRSEPLQQVVRAIRAEGGTATFTRGDVTKTDRVELIVQGAVYTFGGLDILVNSAAHFATGTVLSTDERTWDRVVATNLKGAYLVSRLAVPAMKARGGGAIINNAGMQGLMGLKDRAAWCASKGGLVQLTRAMALDHAADGIRVNAICPGLTDASAQPQESGWFDEVARLAVYLASDEGRWMSGSVLPIEGGCAPPAAGKAP